VVVPAGRLRRRRIAMDPVPPPAPLPGIPLITPHAEETPAPLAWAQGIPVFEAGRLSDARGLSLLAACRPDVGCVSCFPMRLPEEILRLPRHGCINLHPSLLPAFRGPDPLFWIFRQGVQTTGVTVHRMTERMDAGDILHQASFALPDGETEAALLVRCARTGAALLLETLDALARGTLVPRPQDESTGSYFPWPQPEDYLVTPDRPARWAFNFIRGVGARKERIVVRCEGAAFPVREAVAWRPDAVLGEPYQKRGEEVWIQCRPGVLRVRIA
jgi:methionyl-tRNA formyltransferase